VVTFAAEDQARYELLFMRAIPGFEPSPESYAAAVEVFSKADRPHRPGLGDDADFNLWTALVAGLASQQLANDPGGDRDDAVVMFAKHVFGKQPPKRDTKAGVETCGRPACTPAEALGHGHENDAPRCRRRAA
jgi:hypothetical protein